MNRVKFSINYCGNSIEFEFNGNVSPVTMANSIKTTLETLDRILK